MLQLMSGIKCRLNNFIPSISVLKHFTMQLYIIRILLLDLYFLNLYIKQHINFYVRKKDTIKVFINNFNSLVGNRKTNLAHGCVFY